MKVQKFWSFLVLVPIGCLGGVARPHTVEAFLYPSDWIQKESRILQRGDEADVYFPAVPTHWRPYFENAFPIVAVLQGAGVDTGFYEQFGKKLACFGFVVVIPNHLQVLGPPGTPPVPFPDQFVILDVLAQMEFEDIDPGSSLFGIVDTERMGLTGHSVGGVVGLFAIDGRCEPPFCFGLPFFPLPEAVRAGALYGTNTCGAGGELSDPRCIDFGSLPPNPTGMLFDIDNSDIPVALEHALRAQAGAQSEQRAAVSPPPFPGRKKWQTRRGDSAQRIEAGPS